MSADDWDIAAMSDGSIGGDETSGAGGDSVANAAVSCADAACCIAE